MSETLNKAKTRRNRYRKQTEEEVNKKDVEFLEHNKLEIM